MTTKLEAAREKVGEAEENLERRSKALAARQLELAEVETELGSDALDATDDAALDQLRDTLMRCRIDVEVDQAAVNASHARLVDARRALLRVASVVARDRAKRRRGDADKHRERTTQLLAELREHEGAEYQAAVAVDGRRHEAPTISNRMDAEADRLEALAVEIDGLATTAEPNPERIAQLLAVIDPDGPEAAERADRLEHQAGEADAWREFWAAVREARKAWIQARAEKLHQDPDNDLVDWHMAENAALREFRDAQHEHPPTILGMPATPDSINAYALERLGAPVERPAVLAGA